MPRVDLVGHGERGVGKRAGSRRARAAAARDDLAPDPGLPADTRLWARLQSVSGGLWGGCVYDAEAIVRTLEAGVAALAEARAATGVVPG